MTLSCSHEHEGLPAGAVSLSSRTLAAVVEDVRGSLRRAGIERLVVVSGHGGNYVLQNVVQEANADGPRVVLFPTTADREAARSSAGLETPPGQDMHAGEVETSLLLHAAPELVGGHYAERDHVAPPRTHLLVTRDAGLHRFRGDRAAVAGHGGEGRRPPGQPHCLLRRASRAANRGQRRAARSRP